jgi:cell fate regulator YaaT (PSP1 superfamily)
MVQFKGNRKAYYHNRAGLELRPGCYCLVEADRGCDLGQVKYVGPGQPEWWHQADQQGVLQLATTAEIERLHENRRDESGFWDICRDKIRERRLDMNLVTVERQFDHKKITFYFTADQRVDFRELVRDLAAVFRTRIDLRQIGVRDEARLTGGLGVCGRAFCCSSFLQDFVPVTLKMAKVQQLPLNPAKLSGPCGRLRCCLTYEDDVYKQARKSLPRVGTEVTTPEGVGVVRRVDLLQERVAVSTAPNEGLVEWPVARLQWVRAADQSHAGPGPAGGCGGCGGCGREPT